MDNTSKTTPKLISIATTGWGTLLALDTDGKLWHGKWLRGHPITLRPVPSAFAEAK